jgi:hypothetical protein
VGKYLSYYVLHLNMTYMLLINPYKIYQNSSTVYEEEIKCKKVTRD